MRCLILGGDGMLGHQLLRSWRGRHDVRVTLRNRLERSLGGELFTRENTFDDVDVRDTDRLLEVLGAFRPDAVVNAAGVIKQRSAAKDSLACLEINALFPHRLRLLCQAVGARLVHLSTDCVFNGQRGGYRQHEPANAEDLYGLSKYLGELRDAPAVTIRSSIIGQELKGKKSLVEWFLAQRGAIRGFTRAIFTGLTTLEMARVIERILLHHPNLHGVWQTTAAPIDKHALLSKLAEKMGRRDVEIIPDDQFFCDRSLIGDEFTQATGYVAPSWDEMLGELADQIRHDGAEKTARAA